jgi:hypothetical protein
VTAIPGRGCERVTELTHHHVERGIRIGRSSASPSVQTMCGLGSRPGGHAALKVTFRRSGGASSFSSKSLNEAAVDALAEGSGMAGKPRKRRDLRDIAGTWKPDKAVDRALAAQDQVDADLWR